MLKVYHIRHDFVILQTESFDIYIDPFRFESKDMKIKDPNTPNFLLFTHEHSDHFDLRPVFLMAQVEPELTIIMPKSMETTVPDLLKYGVKEKNIILVEPNKNYKFSSFTVYTIPAYNINKFRPDGTPFHPKDKQWVGYIIELQNNYPANKLFIEAPYFKELKPLNVKTIMHTGDSDNIPEYKNLPVTVDMLFVPVSGTYVMTWQEAVDTTKIIDPQIVIPMHYGYVAGTKQDAENFVNSL